MKTRTEIVCPYCGKDLPELHSACCGEHGQGEVREFIDETGEHRLSDGRIATLNGDGESQPYSDDAQPLKKLEFATTEITLKATSALNAAVDAVMQKINENLRAKFAEIEAKHKGNALGDDFGDLADQAYESNRDSMSDEEYSAKYP
jgi:hypothetical protein